LIAWPRGLRFRTKAEARSTLDLIVRVLLVLTIAVLGCVATGFTGCDPTEDSFAVTLMNDTNQRLVANQCGHGCESNPTERDTLKPAQATAVNTSSSRVDNWWQITTERGRVVGCVNLLYDHKEPHAVRRLSRLTRCPSS
jgi:hypothetical protein